ncbi:MAG: bifunctional phosphoglucose/phosphomannose isomerase [Candidatus Limnocylindrales bacterium]
MSPALDDPEALAALDRSDMLGAIAGFPEQLQDGWARTRDVTLPARYRAATSVAVLGMGGSAIGADLVRGVFADRLGVPITTVRDYELPAFVDGSTLVIGSSFSGATEETVAALAIALGRRCPVVVLAGGGPLLAVARSAELPYVAVPGLGQPRAALGATLVLLAGLLERAGLLALEAAEVEAAVHAATDAVARCASGVPTERNPAKQLAWSLMDRLPVIEAAGFLAPVARRWKTQLNENGKSTAVWEELPEATHNAVVGYAQPRLLLDHLFVVFLASSDDHERNALRRTASIGLLDAARIDHEVVTASGDGRLAQAASAIVLGDFTSAYLGLLYGLDPTPVEAIAMLKERLAKAAPTEGDET